MKVKEIIELIDFISKKRLEEVKVETNEIKLSIRKNVRPASANEPQMIAAQPVAATPIVQQAAAPQASTPAPQAEAEPAAKTAAPTNGRDNYITVKSPMIGTFYRASNPETPSFVNVGDKISEGQTVCIIEAMKLFNEIEAEISGTVVEVLVENATPVEYDQPLFLVDPS